MRLIALGALALALTLVGGIVAIGVLLVASGPPPDLNGTRWSIVSVDGARLDEPRPTLAFSAGGASAVASLACGEVQLIWASDSDGSAFNLGVAALPTACARPSRADTLVLDALRTVERQRVNDEGVALLGRHEVQLAR